MTGAGSDVFGKFLLVVVAIWFAPGLYLLPYGLGWFVSALLLAVVLVINPCRREPNTVYCRLVSMSFVLRDT
jgi:hypothetical protein